MANQYTNSVQNHGQGGGGQSQYFQSFDASHFTNPSSNRRRPCPTYTTEQKEGAVQLLHEGIPVKLIAGHMGGSFSKANPYRWLAEERERERQRQAEVDRVRRLEAEARVRDLQVQRAAAARAARIQRHHDADLLFLLIPLFLTEAVAAYLLQSPGLFIVCELWVLILLLTVIIMEILDFPIRAAVIALRMQFFTCAIIWLYVIYHFQITPILFPMPKPKPQPSWYNF